MDKKQSIVINKLDGLLKSLYRLRCEKLHQEVNAGQNYYEVNCRFDVIDKKIKEIEDFVTSLRRYKNAETKTTHNNS